MANGSRLQQIFERDQTVWDGCAVAYEEAIVHGHPDVLAYESFEEDFLDRLLGFLAERSMKPLHLVDVGCGSGRLQARYGLKTTAEDGLPPVERALVKQARATRRDLEYDPLLAGTVGLNRRGQKLRRQSLRGLSVIEGVDFSAEMIRLAECKLASLGLSTLSGGRLRLRQGSAFDLQPMAPDRLPVLATICNSIGVMQGPEGAKRLFQSLRRAAESAGGIAVISAYRKEAVESHALGNYESTMNVSGQPQWLSPDTYAREGYVLVPRRYKRAWDPNRCTTVDVFDKAGQQVRPGLILTRVKPEVDKVIETGHIRTWGDYESRWYGFHQVSQWVDEFWGLDSSWHLPGSCLDVLRGWPCQLAIYDPRRHLSGLMSRWGF